MERITLNSSKKTIEEAFEYFIFAKNSQGLAEKTIKSYRDHLHCISKYLDIRRASAGRQKELIRRSRAATAKSSQNPPKPANASRTAMQRQRKAYAIKRITERNARRGAFGRISSFGVKGSGRAARGAGKLLRSAAEGAKALLSSLSIGGAATVVILVIMVLFGAALTFN